MEVIPPCELVEYLNQNDVYKLCLVNKYCYITFNKYLIELKKWLSKRGRYLHISFIYETYGIMESIVYYMVDRDESFLIPPTITEAMIPRHTDFYQYRSMISRLISEKKIELIDGDLIHAVTTMPSIVETQKIGTYYYSDGKFYIGEYDKNKIGVYDPVERSPFYWMSTRYMRHPYTVPKNKVIVNDDYIEIINNSMIRFKIIIFSNPMNNCDSTSDRYNLDIVNYIWDDAIHVYCCFI